MKDTPDLTYVAPSDIHGLGLMAGREIAEGTFIGTYQGPRAKRDGKFVLWMYEEGREPFGRRGTNTLRYLNHSDEPNATFDGFDLYALTDIQVGEEITIDYGGGEGV